jgi:superfamily II DNA/RNA helicase
VLFSLVLELIPQKEKQVIILSATIPGNSLRDMTKDIMNDPVKILVKKEQLTLEGIQQYFIPMEKEQWKLETLCDLYTNETFTHPTVVFRNSRKRVDQLSTMLAERELSASATVTIPIRSSTIANY